jgi:hypothetical protein
MEKFFIAIHSVVVLFKRREWFFSVLTCVFQIMDPKMDSGCLLPGESLDEEYDVTRSLDPKEVVGIIDQLLCLEVGLLLISLI